MSFVITVRATISSRCLNIAGSFILETFHTASHATVSSPVVYLAFTFAFGLLHDRIREVLHLPYFDGHHSPDDHLALLDLSFGTHCHLLC